MNGRGPFKFQFKPLFVDNYFEWRNNIEAILRGKGLWKHFLPETDGTPTSAASTLPTSSMESNNPASMALAGVIVKKDDEQKKDLELTYILTSTDVS